MSKPIVFDDFSKSAKDLMKDDYSLENKLTFKTKAGKANLTFEAKGSDKVVSKIQCAIQPIEKMNIKKVSVATDNKLVTEVDFPKILKNTTFTYRGESSLSKREFTKNEIGVKYVNDTVALEAAYDIKKTNYKAAAVCSTRYGLFGTKVTGEAKKDSCCKSVDLSLRRECEKCAVALQTQNMFKNANLTFITAPYDNVKLASSIVLPLLEKSAPTVDFGVYIVPYEGQEYRIKVDNEGKLSGVWKVNIQNQDNFCYFEPTIL